MRTNDDNASDHPPNENPIQSGPSFVGRTNMKEPVEDHEQEEHSASRTRSGSAVTKSSQKQIKANRRNGKRSTGPKTSAGKAKSSRNATTHGVFSRTYPIPSGVFQEDPAAVHMFIQQIVQSLDPRIWSEHIQAEQIAVGYLRLIRLDRLLATSIGGVGVPALPAPPSAPGEEPGYRSVPDLVLALEADYLVPSAPEAPEVAASHQAQLVLGRDMVQYTTLLARLNRELGRSLEYYWEMRDRPVPDFELKTCE